MRLFRRRPKLTIEEQLIRRLEKRGIKAFTVLPSAEAFRVERTRPQPLGSTEDPPAKEGGLPE